MKKVKVDIFLVFTHRFQLLKQKNFGQKMRKIFIMLRFFFQIFTISKMKTRTQIFPKMDKNDFMKLKHILIGSANYNKQEKIY
jgi:hypothetical protein